MAPKAKEPEVPVEKLLSEEEKVWANRFAEARQYGFSPEDASIFAGNQTDIGKLRRMKEAGCPSQLAASILT